MADAARQLAPVPSLDAIAEDFDLVEVLPPNAVRDLTARALAVLHALQLRTLKPETPAESGERLLTPEQVAERLNVSTSWVYKNVNALPARVSVAGIARWRAADLDAYIRGLPEVAR